MRLLVTGGCGFIGTNFLRKFAVPGTVNLDKLTYAANPQNLAGVSVETKKCDLADFSAVNQMVSECQPTHVVHFAAESHVDRSIAGPVVFTESNALGTAHLLEACRLAEVDRFVHVSTDEVFGSLGKEGAFTESSPYDPSSPYSASKAAADHLVRAYIRTFGFPAIITNCSNNYGPYQFPEKLIPLMILNALEGKPLPVYGDGTNVRDWIHVEDHTEAVWQVLNQGALGETYLIGGNGERSNLEVVCKICELTGASPDLIQFIKDRPGHDFRYAIDCRKIQRELGWMPKRSFEEGLNQTVNWYRTNSDWVDQVRTGEYLNWKKQHYG